MYGLRDADSTDQGGQHQEQQAHFVAHEAHRTHGHQQAEKYHEQWRNQTQYPRAKQQHAQHRHQSKRHHRNCGVVRFENPVVGRVPRNVAGQHHFHTLIFGPFENFHQLVVGHLRIHIVKSVAALGVVTYFFERVGTIHRHIDHDRAVLRVLAHQRTDIQRSCHGEITQVLYFRIAVRRQIG